MPVVHLKLLTVSIAEYQRLQFISLLCFSSARITSHGTWSFTGCFAFPHKHTCVTVTCIQQRPRPLICTSSQQKTTQQSRAEQSRDHNEMSHPGDHFFKCKFEILYLSFSISCCFILLLHHISEGEVHLTALELSDKCCYSSLFRYIANVNIKLQV